MKILVLSDDFPPHTVGGPAIVASTLALEQKKQGHDIRIITTVRHKDEAGTYDYQGLPVLALYSDYHPRWRAYRSLYNPSTVSSLKKIIKSFKPDVVHAHNIHYHISYHALRIAKRNKAKVILTAHDVMLFHYGKLIEYINPNDTSIPIHPRYYISPLQQIKKYKRWYNPVRNNVIRWYLRYVDHLCAVSGALREALLQNGIKKEIKIIYNGIDTMEWHPNIEAGKKFRTEYALKYKKIILYAGRLQAPKGGKQLIDALKIVSQSIPDAMLVVAGTKDSYGEEMELYAMDLNIRNKILFTGWLQGDDLKAAYNAADVIAFPSVCFDTFGMVNIEAMALEKPVIATCFGGAPEVVEDEVSGKIVNPYNRDMFAYALLDFLKNPVLIKSCGLEGRKRVEKLFSLERQVENYFLLYTH